MPFAPRTLDVAQLERATLAEISRADKPPENGSTVTLQIEDVAPKPMAVRSSFAIDFIRRALDACKSDSQFPYFEHQWRIDPPR